MQKYAFLEKNGLNLSFILDLSAVGNKLVKPTSKKHKTLDILTKVDFYAFFKISHFSRFLKFIIIIQ